ncbi:hypothetical protein A2V71_01865 [Candidatus Berkelbacteria bacterium RBG_13_40_8]|uniref:GlcNAc-PI de-N-acetylase n=1 Tax=Candidatus Berkelbacteria bacterium RBG_13_40_8 TaxID=1797467 RepID=A0A1F5DQ39_9BACT|nr:MAG: hypothetical protein A2V71_01865 [Candidatus Berkelbacteria bacterium RBG_13_40_8]
MDFKKILVLAPHPDDDVFGLGGTISKLTKSGAEVTVAYFCDGSEGVPQISNLKSQISKELIETRKREARESGKILGVSEQVFFGYHDGKLAAGSAAVRALIDLLGKVKPDIIFVPHFCDNHPDHRVVNEILFNSLTQFKSHLEIWAYEIWTPIIPNRIVDINSEIDFKKRAIAVHQSQLKTRGYDKGILGLNQYRAEINNLSGHAEAFFAATPKIYRALYRKS